MMKQGVSLGLALVVLTLSACAVQDSGIKAPTTRPVVVPAVIETLVVPDVTGLTPSDAKTKLALAGARRLDVVDNYVCKNEAVPVGHVCYTTPRAGQVANARILIKLYVRPEPTGGPMPDVIGRTEAEARRILTASGFKRVQTRFLDSAPQGCAPGFVCETSPPAGQKTGFDTINLIYVAKESAVPKP
jgi:beta-lactam-binding protein with PASTA domain